MTAHAMEERGVVVGRLTKQQAGEYVGMFIGLHSATGTTRRIYERRDGGLVGGSQVHHPIGRRAESEVVVVFGLSRIRHFGIHSEEAARAYEQELAQEALSKPSS